MKLSFCVAVGVFIPNAHSATITVTAVKWRRKFQAEQQGAWKCNRHLSKPWSNKLGVGVWTWQKYRRAYKKVCKQKNIHTIHFESHYLYNNRIADLRKEFSDFTLKMKLGLETFDYDFRENVLKKGIKEKIPKNLWKFWWS